TVSGYSGPDRTAAGALGTRRGPGNRTGSPWSRVSITDDDGAVVDGVEPGRLARPGPGPCSGFGGAGRTSSPSWCRPGAGCPKPGAGTGRLSPMWTVLPGITTVAFGAEAAEG